MSKLYSRPYSKFFPAGFPAFASLFSDLFKAVFRVYSRTFFKLFPAILHAFSVFYQIYSRECLGYIPGRIPSFSLLFSKNFPSLLSDLFLAVFRAYSRTFFKLSLFSFSSFPLPVSTLFLTGGIFSPHLLYFHPSFPLSTLPSLVSPPSLPPIPLFLLSFFFLTLFYFLPSLHLFIFFLLPSLSLLTSLTLLLHDSTV